jgi:glycerol-3-phosphate acyltransferase PlsX
MGDSPVEALKKKKGSSIEIATRLVRTGEANAMVSAGNTGACVAAGTILLGLLPDVRRAGIAVCLHAGSSAVIIIDVGANISSKPEHLLQYGIMASLYARSVLRVENPRVGLLNIGEENEKGNQLVKTTHVLFTKAPLNFVGNVEGVEIFRGVCDVIVCDGFVGNIVLKVSEGLAECLVEQFKSTSEQALRGIPVRAASVVDGGGGTKALFGDMDTADPVATVEKRLRSSVTTMREKIDYAEYGGAPLLGVNGVMIMAHGRSDARAITNAVRVARRMVETDINKHITEEIHALTERA